MNWRGAVVGLGCLVSLTQCGRFGMKRNTPAEAGMDIVPVFETALPYSGRKLGPEDFTAFLAKHPEYRADSAAISGFYERRDMQYAWILGDSLSASADAFVAFAGANEGESAHNAELASHLKDLYEKSANGSVETGCGGCAPDIELHLTAEFFHFANRNYNGFLSRDTRDLNWFIPRARKDPNRLLDSLAAGSMDLSAYEPIHPQYLLLKQSIAQYSKIAGEPWPALELPRGTRKLVEGDNTTAIRAIRQRLQLLGDLTANDGSDRYDSTMVSAMRLFQDRHGLAPDGVIGAGVLHALNVPVAQRLRTMLINIERLRWVPEQQPQDLLFVNIPEFRLHVFEDGREVKTMAVVVGSRATHTVVFSDSVAQVVFSPTWTVPGNLLRKEMLPAMRKDPNYLAKHDMEIVGGTDANPQVRQRPGPTNPLGGVKFLFPNSYDIYLHDTPSRRLFEREDRAGSHGCVRLSRAAELAAYLLRNDAEWPGERILMAMKSGHEETVRLREKRPVMIAYFTAWVDQNGRLNFRDDVYGHDAKLARELFVP